MNLFTDQNGKQTVVQWPNPPLMAWILLKVLDALTSIKNLDVAASIVLIIWSFLELWKGDSYFRKGLGAIILMLSLFSLGKRLF